MYLLRSDILSSPAHDFRLPHYFPGELVTYELYPSFFKTLVDHEVTVELKNEVRIRGTLKSVDQYLNIKLDHAEAEDGGRWPHLVGRLAFFSLWNLGSGRWLDNHMMVVV